MKWNPFKIHTCSFVAPKICNRSCKSKTEMGMYLRKSGSKSIFDTWKIWINAWTNIFFKKRRTSVDSFCWPRTGLWPNPFWTASTPKFPGSHCGMKMVIHNFASKSNKVVYRFIQLGYLCTHAAKTSVYVWSVQANPKRPGSVLPEIFPWFWEHQLHPASPPPSACRYLQVWRLHIAWYGCAKAFLVQSGQRINDGTKFQTILQWLRFIDSYAHLNIHNLHVDPIIQYVTVRNQNIKTTFKKKQQR